MSTFACEDKIASEWPCDNSPLKVLEGEVLVRQDGSKFSVTELKGKTIGLYVSAHWCPPCRGYTPKLAAKYKELQDAGEAFEIIFISCDRDAESAKEYFSDHPWTMLDFEERGMEDDITDQLGVTGIPSLTLFSPEDGSVMVPQAREAIMETPFQDIAGYAEKKKAEEEARELAFQEKNAMSNKLSFITGDNTIVSKTGETMGIDAFKGKVVALYFSASWCPPCHRFTPLLAKRFTDLKAEGHPFEIIFVSSDRTADDAQKYYDEMMPWHMLKYEQRDAKSDLSRCFEVRGIPSVILLNGDGELITTNGREVVMVEPFENWARLKEEKAAAEMRFAGAPDSIAASAHGLDELEGAELKKNSIATGFNCDLCERGGGGVGRYQCAAVDFDVCFKCVEKQGWLEG